MNSTNKPFNQISVIQIKILNCRKKFLIPKKIPKLTPRTGAPLVRPQWPYRPNLRLQAGAVVDGVTFPAPNSDTWHAQVNSRSQVERKQTRPNGAGRTWTRLLRRPWSWPENWKCKGIFVKLFLKGQGLPGLGGVGVILNNNGQW